MLAREACFFSTEPSIYYCSQNNFFQCSKYLEHFKNGHLQSSSQGVKITTSFKNYPFYSIRPGHEYFSNLTDSNKFYTCHPQNTFLQILAISGGGGGNAHMQSRPERSLKCFLLVRIQTSAYSGCSIKYYYFPKSCEKNFFF